jgi:tRNA threonylcarbamoyl adenosine modification protein YeaZ
MPNGKQNLCVSFFAPFFLNPNPRNTECYIKNEIAQPALLSFFNLPAQDGKDLWVFFGRVITPYRMLVFALDTSTLQGSMGWVNIDDTSPSRAALSHASLSAPAVPGHAETVLHRMEQTLATGGFGFKEIGLLVYGRGPGTFTGIRIGLSTIKGIALTLGIPIIGISSLEASAFSAYKPGLVAALIDAKRKELFAALYEAKIAEDGRPFMSTILEEWVGPAADVIERIAAHAAASTVLVTGNGAAPYRDLICEALNASILPECAWAPNPFWMCRIGYTRFQFKGQDDLDSVEPVYLRAPDARLPAVKLL